MNKINENLKYKIINNLEKGIILKFILDKIIE